MRVASYCLDVTTPAFYRDGKHEAQERNLFAKLKTSDYDVVCVPAEFIVNNATLYRLWLEESMGGVGRIPIGKRVRFIAVEDAHLASYWKRGMGYSRPAWQGLHKLRRYFDEDKSPIMAISGSMTATAVYNAKHALRLQSSYVHINLPIGRNNVFLSVLKMTGKPEKRLNLKFVMTKMDGKPALKREEVPRAIIFEDDSLAAADAAKQLELLAAKEYGIRRKPDLDRPAHGIPVAAAFHPLLDVDTREWILRHWKAGTIRIIVASETIGLDLGAGDLQIDRAISFGCLSRNGVPLTFDAFVHRLFGFAALADQKAQGLGGAYAPAWMFNKSLPSSTDEEAHLIGSDGETITMAPDVHAMISGHQLLSHPVIPVAGPAAEESVAYWDSDEKPHPEDRDVVIAALRRMRTRCFYEQIRSENPKTTQTPLDVLPDARLIAAANRYRPGMSTSELGMELGPSEAVQPYDLEVVRQEVDHIILAQQAARGEDDDEDEWDEEGSSNGGTDIGSVLSVD